uniref:hypothetical protein n=1 Tax=Arthrobacter silvisoli TaxID=2291022 RepID=UPI003F499EB3
MADLVIAVNKNGAKQYVPPHFLELSAAGVPGFDFKLPPSARAKETPIPKAPKPAVTKEDANA